MAFRLLRTNLQKVLDHPFRPGAVMPRSAFISEILWPSQREEVVEVLVDLQVSNGSGAEV